MQVVRAQTAHADALIPLFDGYRQTYGCTSNLALAEEFVTARLDAQDTCFLLAIDGDYATGFAHLYYSYTSVSAQRLLVLNDLFTAPQARRRGAAEALLKAAQAYAKETGCRGIKLETQTHNIGAKNLYEKAGYTRIVGAEIYYLTLVPGRVRGLMQPKRGWLRRWLGR